MKINRIIKKYILQKVFSIPVKLRAREYGDSLKVNAYSRVTKNTILGNNVNFNGMIIKGGGYARIGDNFHSGTECLIITQNHNYEGNEIPYDNSYIKKEVTIDDNVWLGDRVIVLGGAHIEEGAIIQAGSVVCGHIPKYAIAGGHPAKPFAQRDIQHYEELKKECRFH